MAAAAADGKPAEGGCLVGEDDDDGDQGGAVEAPTTAAPAI